PGSEPFANPLEDPYDGEFRAPDLRADLGYREALQPQLQHLALAFLEYAHQLFQRLGEDGCLLRCRLTGQGLPAGSGVVGARCGDLAMDVVAGAVVAADLATALAHSEDDEQPPQVVPAFQFKLAVGLPPEEASKNRLHHVLGADLLPQERI